MDLGSILDDLGEPPKPKSNPAVAAKPKAPVMMGGEEEDNMF